MNSDKLHDIGSVYKNHLYFYTLLNTTKIKVRKIISNSIKRIKYLRINII